MHEWEEEMHGEMRDSSSWVVYRIGMYNGKTVVNTAPELRRRRWERDGVWKNAGAVLLAEGLTQEVAEQMAQLAKEE